MFIGNYYIIYKILSYFLSELELMLMMGYIDLSFTGLVKTRICFLQLKSELDLANLDPTKFELMINILYI